MSSDFVCKSCGHRSQYIDATFNIEFAASYVHDGSKFRQHSLRVTGCSLNEDMENAPSSCINCDVTGIVAEMYDRVLTCGNCGEDAGSKGGYCVYNRGVYCSKCYGEFKHYCDGCASRGKCKLLKANISTKERIRQSVKAKEETAEEVESPAQMARRLTEELNFDRSSIQPASFSTAESSSGPVRYFNGGMRIVLEEGTQQIESEPEWVDDEEMEDE